MEKVYKAYKDKDIDYLEYYIGMIHLTLKQAGVAHVLSPTTVKEMQEYFWLLLNDFEK